MQEVLPQVNLADASVKLESTPQGASVWFICTFEKHKRLQITITINMRTHSRRKNHYEKIPLSIYIILQYYIIEISPILLHTRMETEHIICNRNL